MKPGPGLIALAFALWAGAAARDAGDAWIGATALPPLAVETSVEVLARDGRLLRAYTVADGRWRMAVELSEVDPAYVALLIDYEDRRFRSHPGVDVWALARAGWQALHAGRVVSGGSTLSMQVARLLEDSGTGRPKGKLRQMRVALALERRLTKDQVLALYLHLAPYGGNVEGLRAATLAWFGKEPRRLTPAEAALMVALPQSPETRRPDRHAAAVARARVLDRAARGGILTAEQAQAALREPVPTARRPVPALAPHLADRLRAEQPETRIHRTSLDAGLQARLEALAAEALQGRGERMQVAMILADHASGDVLATVGSGAYQADARAGFVDMTRAIRSPGSTLKPLVYGLAFDEGLAHPETLIDDRPADFAGYAPQNFDRMFRGTIRVREALQQSLNLPVVALTDALGAARLMAAMRRGGAAPRVPGGRPGLAVALGGVGISLEHLTGLYGAIARGGVARPLHYGQGAGGQGTAGQRVIGAVAAWQLGDIMAGMPPPPGAPANRLAYKTGTSYGHRDAWALGFDGRHVAGVWMGRADGTPVPGAFGGDLAAPVLFQAFQRLKPALDPLPPPPPATLLVANADLPQPLRRFRSRAAAFDEAPDAPAIAFPKDGTEVELLPEGLMLRVRGGRGPFTWLADGTPVVLADPARETMIAAPGAGFVTLSVIDAAGRSARVRIRLR
ncbi:MAG: penicillin-binding protein 1C [Gemmobacter sp.]